MNSVLRWIAILIGLKILFFTVKLGLGIVRLHFFGAGDGDSDYDSPEALAYREAGERFGVAVVEQRWPDAYAMMTSDFRSRRTIDQFVSIMRSAEEEYVQEGRALTAIAAVNAWGEEVAHADFAADYDIPETIPRTPAWKAYIVNEMVLELDEEGHTYRCFDQGLLMVDEPEGPRVAYVEYWWCD